MSIKHQINWDIPIEKVIEVVKECRGDLWKSAEALGKGPGYVANRLHHARLAIKDILGGYEKQGQ